MHDLDANNGTLTVKFYLVNKLSVLGYLELMGVNCVLNFICPGDIFCTLSKSKHFLYF